jgi:nucleotide-binding universal stress UspA family protein
VKQVLLAYDGSAPAQRALVHAANLARPGDVVNVVNVMPEPGVSARMEPPIEERNRQWHFLDEAERYLAGRDLEVRKFGPVGDAAVEILAAAEQIGADVIVVARRHGRRAHLLGSISSRLVHSAKCDVLVVHGGSREGGGDAAEQVGIGTGAPSRPS